MSENRKTCPPPAAQGPLSGMTAEKRAAYESNQRLRERLFGELDKQVECDFAQAEHYGDEALERLKRADKDIGAALQYLPTHIACLKAAGWCPGPHSFVEDMRIANFGKADMERFAEAWIDTMEQCGAVDVSQMYFYLLGQHTYDINATVAAPGKKDFARALAFLPTWLREARLYDADITLQELVHGMRKVGYAEADVSLFATRFVQERGDALWYSTMGMQLFSEHMSGAHIDLPGLGDFERAVSLLPTYVDHIVHFDKMVNEYSNRFDPDGVLYSLIVKMRKHDFPEERISRFATEWLRAMEQTGNVCYMRMFAYLFGEFAHTNYPKEDHFEPRRDVIALMDIKNLEKALDYVPAWMAFLNDGGVQYDFGYDPQNAVWTVFKQMLHTGYAPHEAEAFLLRVAGCDASFENWMRCLYREGEYRTEYGEVLACHALASAEKYAAFVEQHGDGTIGGVFAVEPDGVLVKYIGEDVEHIEIPAVKTIRARAFFGLKNLRSIHIPAEVEHILPTSFYECPALCEITVDSANPHYYSEGNCLIQRQERGLVFSTGAKQMETVNVLVLKGKGATVPEGVEIPDGEDF